jgi:hypothetical protein
VCLQQGDKSSRRVRPEVCVAIKSCCCPSIRMCYSLQIRTKCVQFSPNGRSWAAATTEGLMNYSLDEKLVFVRYIQRSLFFALPPRPHASFVFDPLDLSLDVTPETIAATVDSGDVLRALLMAFRFAHASSKCSPRCNQPCLGLISLVA